MKKTTTRLVIERQKLTVLRPAVERSAVSYSEHELMLLPESGDNHSNRRFPKKLTIPLGLVIWLTGGFVVDLIVLQIFPVPADLWRNGSMAEIIASRPTAAVTINLCGQLIMLGVVVFGVTRFTRHAAARAGLIMTAGLLSLPLVNTLLTRTVRWPVVVGFLLAPVVGYVATKLAAR